MRVYLSGPITYNPDYEEIFLKAAEEAKNLFRETETSVFWAENRPFSTENAKEPTIINPVALQAVLPDGNHDEYMKLCFSLLDMSDVIYMIHGWEQSKGACMEYGFAVAKNMRIIGQL